MRLWPLLLLLALSACGQTRSNLSALQPGVDVAQAALRGGSPQTALQLAGNVLVHDPGNEAALVVQGDALTDLGQFAQARESYDLALKTNPESVGAEIGLGRLLLASDPAGAEARFLQALHHNPRDTIALNDLGVARDLQGNHLGAQRAYSRALGISPDDTDAQVNLALSMAMSGNADRAVGILRPLASDPGASRKLRHDLAAALAMAGDQNAAARILSADLTPDQVRQALAAFAAARSAGNPPAVMPTPGNPPATMPMGGNPPATVLTR
jgi:Flp pilus assembly protein TadD